MSEMLDGYVQKLELNVIDYRLMVGLTSKVPTSSLDESVLKKHCKNKENNTQITFL